MLAFDRHEGPADRPLVLVHSLALDRSIWDGLISHLRGRFDIISVDLPGHGGSSAFQGTTVGSMAAEVASLLDGERTGPVVVIGLSLGGCVAQSLAVQRPDLVRGLALLDTTCWYGESAPKDWRARAQRALDDGLESLAGFQLARWFSPGFLEEEPEVGKRLLEVFVSTDLESYVASCRAMGDFDLRKEIEEISVPTTVIVGADDPATSPAHAEQIRQRIGSASLHVIPGCSHLSAVERPGSVARLLEADLFLRVFDGLGGEESAVRER